MWLESGDCAAHGAHARARCLPGGLRRCWNLDRDCDTSPVFGVKPKFEKHAFARLWLLLTCLFLPVGIALQAAATDKPNIVIILADDLGWADVGYQGADLIETPNIDRFARENVRFTQAYAMSVCSPTRATLLTGRHAARVHITIWAEGSLKGPQNRKLLQGESLHDLPHSESTVAKLLRDAGYLTALVGKWHLGEASHFPETHGFDINIGGTHWGAPETFSWPYSGSGRFGDGFRYVPHLEFGKPGEYLTDRLTDEALKIIDRAGEKPFFLYLAHHAVHTPMEAKKQDIEYFERKLKPGMKHQNPVYAAMTKSLDDSVGRVLKHLDDRGLAKNTIVVFTSDNGGFIGVDRKAGQKTPVTNNSPLRSGKGSLYEGGIRVPLAVRWPGVTPRGGVCETPVLLADLFPTLLAAAKVAGPANIDLDGIDLSAVLQQPETGLARKELFFHYPHYYETTTPVSAVRAGDWKLLEYLEDGKTELFNLKADEGESKDLSASNSQQVAALKVKLNAWRSVVKASMPTPNPNFKPKKK